MSCANLVVAPIILVFITGRYLAFEKINFFNAVADRVNFSCRIKFSAFQEVASHRVFTINVGYFSNFDLIIRIMLGYFDDYSAALSCIFMLYQFACTIWEKLIAL
ncbi:hypothetical protein SDC9_134020 [bioreactor metagenome]|uniref:Uncharacterized protein n=1 Tax=bioreactor metagenome TaxID=1076179 RepID=A0A645DCI3_9ZZZZ